MNTIVQMNGNDYEVTLPEPFQSGEPTVFVIIHRDPVSRRGNYVQDIVYRTIKPHSPNWKRAVRMAKEALLGSPRLAPEGSVSLDDDLGHHGPKDRDRLAKGS